MNLPPDLINVFKNAGHLLGLVSCGLKNGEVLLKVIPDETRVCFRWRYSGPNSLSYSNMFIATFSALDQADEAWLKYHAAEMIRKFDATIDRTMPFSQS